MRIGMVVPGGVDRSGSHRIIPYLVERLRELSARHDLHVVALRQEEEPGHWTLEGAEVHNVGSRGRRLRALGHLAREHRRSPFDVLHGYALVPQGALVAVAGRLLGVPWVVEAPGGDFTSLPEIAFGGWSRWTGRAWVRLACAGAHACAVPTEPARRVALERGFPAERIPLELSAARWPRAATPAGESRRVAWVASLNEVKDPRLLVETVKALAGMGCEVEVDVVGEDVLGGAVQRHARDEGVLDRMTFHGFLTQDRVREVLAGAAVLLLTSRFEGGPRVVLEAASLGIPTVGTHVGYVAEWCPDAAVSVRPGTPEGLADALRILLLDPGRRRALGTNAVNRLLEHEAGRVAARWEELYRGAASRRGRGV